MSPKTLTDRHDAAMVGYFDGQRKRAGYRGAISPRLAPWATLIGRITAKFDLADYPQVGTHTALAEFAASHGRDANPLDPVDWDAVEALLLRVGGWGENE